MSRAVAWRYPFFAPTLDDAARGLAAAIETPLQLGQRGRWDPAEEYWGEPSEPVEPYLKEIIAAGPREAWEQEQIVPGIDRETFDDPILEATELHGQAERIRARELLRGVLADEPRCLDAHAHLGAFAYAYSAKLALPHYEAGVAIGERSLPSGFDGVLPWGWIDNRPFLRCLHGYGLCLWRLVRFEEAETVFMALLWLNPPDNQGAGELVETARARAPWEPTPRWPGRSLPGESNGRRALLDRAAPLLEAPPRTPPQEEIDTAFAPLLWLLDRAEKDGLPLTQTGALGRSIVQEAVAEFPAWWDVALFGPPRREAELALLETLHDLCRRARLLRRRKRRLPLTARARQARRKPDLLLDTVASHLYGGYPFECEMAEFASAVLLIERKLDVDSLVATVHDAAVEDWRSAAGTPIGERDVRRTLWPLRHALLGLGVLSEQPDPSRLSLSDAGAELLARALRLSAIA